MTDTVCEHVPALHHHHGSDRHRRNFYRRLTAFVFKHLRAKVGGKSTDARAQTKHQKQEDKNAVYQNETNVRSAA
jgi:hypothetical protein